MCLVEYKKKPFVGFCTFKNCVQFLGYSSCEGFFFVYCNFLGSLSINEAPRPTTRNGTSVIIAAGKE